MHTLVSEFFLIMEAQERRNVATLDIPSTFIQADMDEKVHLKLDVKTAKLIVNIMSIVNVLRIRMVV